MSEERELRIGEVAKLAGTTPRTIRYYEEIGLLPATETRRPGAHRTYAEADVDRLTELLRLKDLLGLSLEELKELVEAEGARAELRREWRGGVEDPVRRRQILEESLTYTSRQLALVRRRRNEIAKLEAELIARRRRVQTLLREAGAGRHPSQNTQARR
ncbi:MAG TPA: MerR family transcriptional regulator [Solirubrobacterales bacterium]|nr:MerR family transcriptional regulator [Solirubrobacterales bacterium]